jgi:DNA-binding NarL/FixJ family response regulator
MERTEMTTDEIEPVRVLLVDDHPMFLEGLRLVLTSQAGIAVVGEATDGNDAVVAALDLQPDVVVMDLNLPGQRGIDATRQIVAASPHIAVLVLTMFDDDDSVFAAMRAGARGYLLKGAARGQVVRAIVAVSAGAVIFGPSVARHMQRFFEAPPVTAALFPGLTPREHEVLDLVARGRSNTDIARVLGVSGKTVRNHVSNIFAKLQVADRAQAIVRARSAGLGDGVP